MARYPLQRAAFFCLVCWCGWTASAATAALPTVLDVPTPYIPSTPVDVEELLQVTPIGPQDNVVDLGSGDGRIVITAAKYFGARGFGVDIDDKLVQLSNANARSAGVADRVQFYHKDIFDTDLSSATVVTIYLLSSLVNRLEPKLLAELKPGTRIVAHDYGFDDWKPDRTVKVTKTFYLYVVPAQVGGKWRMQASLPEGERNYDLELNQRFQELSGGTPVQGGYLPLFEARLNGQNINFVIVDNQHAYHYEGRVTGNTMEGTVKTGIGNARVERRWRATLTTPAAQK